MINLFNVVPVSIDVKKDIGALHGKVSHSNFSN